MNIKSLLIAAVVACTGTMVANAQNPEILSNESALAQGVCGNNECGPKRKCNKGECAAFEGLNLTDAQKTALAQLKADRKNKAIEAKKQKRQQRQKEISPCLFSRELQLEAWIRRMMRKSFI